MRKIFLFLLFSTLWAGACDKASDCADGTNMTLVDRTGLDGCTWLLEKGDKVYEPINLDEFDVRLTDGSNYCVEFEPAEDMASICMAGTIIRILSIRKID